MKKWIPFLLLVFVVAGCQSQPEVCFEDDCFDVEVASEPEDMKKGLMHRENLAQDRGMLFVFPEPGRYSFWMKNTLIPLDMIWLSKEGTVVAIHKNATPCEADPCPSYKPDATAKYVLEVNAGTVERIGLELGEKADIET